MASDALSTEGYDGDLNTKATGNTIYVDKTMIGKQVKVTAGGQMSLIDSNGSVIKTEGLGTGVVFTILEGTEKLKYSATHWSHAFAEIGPVLTSTQSKARKKVIVPSNDNSTEENIKIPNFIESPTINVSASDKYTATKEVTISYPSGGYINQYSLDGENWINYTGVINIDKETTVFARSVNDGKVISSSSHQITRIDNIKPTISLDNIPSKINVGDEYSLLENYSFNFNKSGGTVSCTLDGSTEITTTKEISAGSHNIKCSATTGSGIVSTVEKNIEVVDNSEKVPENKEITEESQEETKKEGEESEEEKKLNGESTTEESNTNNS